MLAFSPTGTIDAGIVAAVEQVAGKNLVPLQCLLVSPAPLDPGGGADIQGLGNRPEKDEGWARGRGSDDVFRAYCPEGDGGLPAAAGSACGRPLAPGTAGHGGRFRRPARGRADARLLRRPVQPETCAATPERRAPPLTIDMENG